MQNQTSTQSNDLPVKPSLRISVVTETYPPEINGVAITAKRLVTGLQNRGHHVQLVRPFQPDVDSEQEPFSKALFLSRGGNIPGYPGLRFGYPCGRRLIENWRQHPVDIVHVDTEGPLGWSAVKAARRLRIPVISSFHTNFHQYSRHYGMGLLHSPVNAYLRYFHNASICTLVPTREMEVELTAHGYRRLEVLGRGIDTGLFSPGRRSTELRTHWGLKDNELAMIYVGRIAAEKNLELAVKTYRAMQQRNPDIRFILVGDGPLRAALSEANPDFIMAGMQTGVELARHYASADIFLFPSLTETFGNVVLEAMASGLCVIAFDYAAAHEHLHHQWSGLTPPAGNADEFIRLGSDIIHSPERIKSMGRHARHSIKRFDWSAILDTFEDILFRQSKNPRGCHVVDTGYPATSHET